MLLHFAWISNKFVLGYCIAAAPYLTRIIGVQIAELQLKQPNLEVMQCSECANELITPCILFPVSYTST